MKTTRKQSALNEGERNPAAAPSALISRCRAAELLLLHALHTSSQLQEAFCCCFLTEDLCFVFPSNTFILLLLLLHPHTSDRARPEIEFNWRPTLTFNPGLNATLGLGLELNIERRKER